MKLFMNYMNKRGTVSLETAISFSIVLVFMTAIISVTAFLRTDILMQRAVSQSCDDIAHFMPFTVLVSDSVSTLVNALPDGYEDDGTIERAGEVLAAADNITGGEIRAGMLNILLGQRFTDDIASEYAEYNGSSFFGPDSITVDFGIEDYYIDVCVEYSVNTIIGPVSRKIYSTIPFYGDFELFLSEDEPSEDSSESIWHENNFVRGRYFAEQYGGNLPSTFPTINSYSAGTAGSVVSIDLNRPTYADPSATVIRLTEQIDELAGFNGADVQIDGERYVVYGDSIRQRILTVVIPEDSPDTGVSTVYSMREYASLRGIDLRVVQDGNSL